MSAATEVWQDAVFTDGHFHRPAAGGTIPVRDKASGEIFAVAGLATAADVDVAVGTARTAQAAWSERTYAERAAVLRSAAVALTNRAKEFRDPLLTGMTASPAAARRPDHTASATRTGGSAEERT